MFMKGNQHHVETIEKAKPESMLKCNTAIPSSAATEHLFSTGKDIFSANVHEGQPASRWDDGEEAEEARVNA